MGGVRAVGEKEVAVRKEGDFLSLGFGLSGASRDGNYSVRRLQSTC